MSKVISSKQMPVHPTRVFWWGVFLWLLMDRLRPPIAVQAIVWTLYGLLFIASIVLAVKQEQVELEELKDKK